MRASFNKDPRVEPDRRNPLIAISARVAGSLRERASSLDIFLLCIFLESVLFGRNAEIYKSAAERDLYVGLHQENPYALGTLRFASCWGEIEWQTPVVRQWIRGCVHLFPRSSIKRFFPGVLVPPRSLSGFVFYAQNSRKNRTNFTSSSSDQISLTRDLNSVFAATIIHETECLS